MTADVFRSWHLYISLSVRGSVQKTWLKQEIKGIEVVYDT